jgi:Mrp family chromosome partitioning ATPase
MSDQDSSNVPHLTALNYDSSAGQQQFTAEQLGTYLRLPEIKRLIHRLVSAQHEHNFTSLAIVSLLPKEGRTFVVSLIALAYATVLKKRVLILDTVSQNREASLHLATVMRESATPINQTGDGLEPKLQDACGVDLVATRSLRPEGKNMTTANNAESVSPLQTAEFLMQPFLTALAPSYDIILLDTCPLENVTADHFDPLVLARQVDQVIGLVSPLSTSRDRLMQLNDQLQQAQISLLGIVRNFYKPN